MKWVKRIFGIAALLADLLGLLTGCVIDLVDVDADSGHSREVEVSETFSRTLPVSGQSTLRVEAANGSVDIWGIPGAHQVTVEAVRRVRSDSRSDARNHLVDLQVSIESRSSEFVVKTQQPRASQGRTYIVDYQITLPADFLVKLSNGNGSVRLVGVQGDVVAQNGNGDVELSEAEGSSWITVGNGKISAQVVLPRGGRIVHAIGNGSLSLSVQRQVSACFDAKVGNGFIHVEGLEFHEMVSSPRRLTGRLGSGAGIIDLSVGNGGIWVAGG